MYPTTNIAPPFFSSSNSVISPPQPTSWFNYDKNRQSFHCQNEPVRQDGDFNSYENQEPEDNPDYNYPDPGDIMIRPGAFEAPINLFSWSPHSILPTSEQPFLPDHTSTFTPAAAPPQQDPVSEVECRLNEVMYEVCW